MLRLCPQRRTALRCTLLPALERVKAQSSRAGREAPQLFLHPMATASAAQPGPQPAPQHRAHCSAAPQPAGTNANHSTSPPQTRQGRQRHTPPPSRECVTPPDPRRARAAEPVALPCPRLAALGDKEHRGSQP